MCWLLSNMCTSQVDRIDCDKKWWQNAHYVSCVILLCIWLLDFSWVSPGSKVTSFQSFSITSCNTSCVVKQQERFVFKFPPVFPPDYSFLSRLPLFDTHALKSCCLQTCFALILVSLVIPFLIDFYLNIIGSFCLLPFLSMRVTLQEASYCWVPVARKCNMNIHLSSYPVSLILSWKEWGEKWRQRLSGMTWEPSRSCGKMLQKFVVQLLFDFFLW